jgi:GNAT superfamily N-acetyltransferase
MTKKVEFVLATTQDISEIVNFLSMPEIDNAFVFPLSHRLISIEQRVTSKFSDGFWLLARFEGRIVGVRGCKGIIDPEKRIVEFSTIATHPEFRGSGLGTILLKKSVEIAFARYHPLLMKFPSWSTNIGMTKATAKAGFTRGQEFDDPWKRPSGIKSVEYTIDCRDMYK